MRPRDPGRERFVVAGGALRGLVLALLVLPVCGPAGAADEPAPVAPAVPVAGGGAADGTTGILDLALEVARRDHPGLDEGAVRAGIDALADRWRARVPVGAPPAVRADAFARVLFEDEGFTAVADLDSPRTLHVDSVLADRAGYCLSLSVVALAMAERLGEPLHGVALPNHFLVRWDDGAFRRNLELTREGEVIDDDTLRAELGDLWSEASLYMRNLSVRQVHGVLLHNRGFVAMQAGRLERARADLTEAARRVPEMPEVHRNLGVLAGERRDWEEAIASFERALALNAGDGDALLNAAIARHASGDPTRARQDLRILRLLQPDHPRAARLEREWAREGVRPVGGRRDLDDPPPALAPGLRGVYFRDARLQRVVAERIDADLDFDWGRGRPLRGLSSDGSSARWEGWLRIDRAGVHTLFVVANDGVRITVGDALVVDRWDDVGYTSWIGSGEVALTAGWYPLRVEWFDGSGNARLYCRVGREGDEYPLPLAEHLFHQER